MAALIILIIKLYIFMKSLDKQLDDELLRHFKIES